MICGFTQIISHLRNKCILNIATLYVIRSSCQTHELAYYLNYHWKALVLQTYQNVQIPIISYLGLHVMQGFLEASH